MIPVSSSSDNPPIALEKDRANSLRRRAEAHLESLATANPPSCDPETQNLLQELSIHQVELEMQEHELQNTCRELETAKKRYFQFFLNAPVAVLLLNPARRILEANLAAREILLPPSPPTAKERLDLALQERLVGKESKVWQDFLDKLEAGEGRVRGEICLTQSGGEARFFALTGSLLDEGTFLVYFQDITESHEREAQLDLLRTAVDQSAAAVVLTDPEARITYANPAFYALTGFAADDVLGQDPRTQPTGLLPPDHAPAIWDNFPALQPWENEFLNQRKDGSTYWESIRMAAVRSAKQKLLGYIMVKQDISATKEIQEDLIRQERVLELLVNLASTFMHTSLENIDATMQYALEQVGQMIQADRAYQILFDHEKRTLTATHEWCAQGTASILPALQNMPMQLFDDLPEGITEGRALVVEDIDTLPPGSTRSEVERHGIQSLLIYPIFDDEKLIGLAGVDLVRSRRSFRYEEHQLVAFFAHLLAGISRRLHHQSRLLESEQRQQLLLRNSPSFIYRLAPDGTLLDCSDNLQALWGYLPENVIGTNFRPYIHPEDVKICETQIFQALQERRIVPAIRHRLLDSEGNTRWVRTVIAPVFQADGTLDYFIGNASDITELRATLEKVERFSLLTSWTTNPVIFTDAERRITWANPAFTKTTGYRLEEVIGTTPSFLHGPETDPLVVVRMKQALDLGEGFTEEVLHYCQDGRSFWAKLEVLPHYHANGDLLGFVSVQTDITEIRDREEELLAFRAAVEHSHSVVYIADLGPRITYVNPAFERVTGYSKEEALGQSPGFIRSGETPDSTYVEMWDRLSQLLPWEGTLQNRRKNGDYYWEHSTIAPIFDRNGQHRGYISVKNDISAQKEAELLYEKNNEQLQSIIDAIPGLVYLKNSEGRYLMINQTACEQAGLSKEDFMGKTDAELEFIPPHLQKKYMDDDRHVLETAETLQMEEQAPLFRGSLAWFLSIKKKIEHPDYPQGLLLGVSFDISLTHELQNSLRRAREEAEAALAQALEATRAKSEFLATMSHEIRTPLNSVLGLTRVLQESRLEARQRKFLDMIQSNGELLLSVVNDILDFSKIEAGKLEIVPEPFDLRALLLDFCEGSALRARQKNLRCSRDLSEDLPSWVVGDSARLLQILHNFMSNALKFTKHGEIRLTVSVDGEKEGAPLVRFTVRDTGIGIPADKQSRIFDRFQQADASISRRFGGTGLGLAISRELALRMGGDIGLESVEGSGSAFWFTARLPEAAPAERVPTDDFISSGEAFPRFTGKILVAEDYPPNRIVIQELLNLFGLECTFAENGQQAIERVAAEPYDLVFMDVQMPEVDGLQATRRIREGEAARDLPIIALTAHIHAEDRQRCLDAGMQDYLSKPIMMEELKRILQQRLPLAEEPTAGPEAPLAAPAAPLAASGDGAASFHPAAMIQALGGREEFARRFAVRFLESADRDGEVLATALEAGDLVQVADVAHRLAGASGYLQAPHFVQCLHTIERVAREGDPDSTRRAHEEFKTESSRFLQAVRAYFRS